MLFRQQNSFYQKSDIIISLYIVIVTVMRVWEDSKLISPILVLSTYESWCVWNRSFCNCGIVTSLHQVTSFHQGTRISWSSHLECDLNWFVEVLSIILENYKLRCLNSLCYKTEDIIIAEHVIKLSTNLLL